MAPKGGIKQRLGLAKKEVEPEQKPRSRSRSLGRASSPPPSALGSNSSSSTALSVRGSSANTLRAAVRDLFLSNTISAVDAAKLARAGKASGATDVTDLAAAGGSGNNRNTRRDLMRSLLRGCKMPPLYEAKVPLWFEGQAKLYDFPMLLPHEVLAHLKMVSPHLLEEARPAAAAMPELLAVVSSLEAKLATGPGLIPLGLHGDVVPYTKSQSLEALSWNLPAKPLWERILFTVVPEKFCCQCGCKGARSWDAMAEVFSWSARCMVLGVHPTLRHDGQPLDPPRQRLASKPLGFKAPLVQVRGTGLPEAIFSAPCLECQKALLEVQCHTGHLQSMSCRSTLEGQQIDSSAVST